MSINSKLIILESPYAADTLKQHNLNVKYARRCLKDSLDRGEFPFASHLLYTQKGVLNDKIPEEREKGILAGYAWMEHVQTVAFYMDHGISPGMAKALAMTVVLNKRIDYRYLNKKED